MKNNLIKKIFILTLIIMFSKKYFSQSCNYDGKTYYIAFNYKKKVFKDTSSTLGEFGLYFDVLNCTSNKSKITISTKILFSPLEAKDKAKPFCFVFLAKRCKNELQVIDTLGSFKIYEIFDLTFEQKKNTYLIFYNEKLKSFAVKTINFK